MDQTLHRVATKEREEIMRTTKQKMARRQNKEGGKHLDQESNRQKTMEEIDGMLHPAVDEQSLGKRRNPKPSLSWPITPLYETDEKNVDNSDYFFFFFCVPYLYLWCSSFFFFFFCIP